MKKQAINFSWPATLSDFSTDTANENFSRGKLKVFYKGETADHRFFSNDFSEQLVESLPYTPIVSYYDEEKDDFVGHATEQQILGIVDPCLAPSFEEDDNGKTWCVCDVVLYTERPDKVGDLAKKIVGHSQSLELDPSSVKYTINYDEKKHFKNIEFTAGRFVGVSVLGDDQQPAFTGSSFFSYDEQFENKMKTLREYCETKRDQTQSGGNTMNLQEFMKLSWGDISSKVADAIYNEYANDAYTMPVDMFEDSAIMRFYYYVGECKLMRVKYSITEDGDVTLGDVNEVHITYEDIIAPKTTMSEGTGVTQTTEAESEPSNEDPATQMEENTEVVEETTIVEDSIEDCAKKDKEKKDEDPKDESSDDKEPKDKESDDEKSEDDKSDEDDEKKKKDKEDFVDAACKENGGDATPSEEEAAQVVNAEVTETEKKVSVDNETEQEVSSGSTSFAESERAELEALKREKKVTLVDSYKGNLSEEEYNSFIEKIDSFSAESLELELLKAYKRAQENKVEEDKKPIRAFSFAPAQESKTESPLDAFVRKNIR